MSPPAFLQPEELNDIDLNQNALSGAPAALKQIHRTCCEYETELFSEYSTCGAVTAHLVQNCSGGGVRSGGSGFRQTVENQNLDLRVCVRECACEREILWMVPPCCSQIVR